MEPDPCSFSTSLLHATTENCNDPVSNLFSDSDSSSTSNLALMYMLQSQAIAALANNNTNLLNTLPNLDLIRFANAYMRFLMGTLAASHFRPLTSQEDKYSMLNGKLFFKCKLFKFLFKRKTKTKFKHINFPCTPPYDIFSFTKTTHNSPMEGLNS